MKNIYIVLLVVLFYNNVYCQDIIDQKRKSFVTFSIFTPVLNQAHRWKAGYMYNFENRFWVGTSIGYGLKRISIVSAEFRRSSEQDYQLYEIRPELYFDLNRDNRAKQFLSFEVFYINHRDRFVDSFYQDVNTKQEFTFDSANYKRIKTGFNINYNIIIPIYNRICLIQKVGLGYKHRNVTFSNVQNLEQSIFPLMEDHFNNDYLFRVNGAASSLHFNLDLQLVYKF